MVRASDKYGLLNFHYKRLGNRPDTISQLNTIRSLMQCIYNNTVISDGGEAYTGCWWGHMRERDHLGDPGVGERIILTRISRK